MTEGLLSSTSKTEKYRAHATTKFNCKIEKYRTQVSSTSKTEKYKTQALLSSSAES
jgi:hypothetical protein